MKPQRGPLAASPVRTRTRRGTVIAVVLAIVGILVLTAATVAVALTSVFAERALPSPTLTPSSSAVTDPAVVTEPQSLTEVADGQTMRLELPAGEPVGIALLYPGSADPDAVLTSAWAVALADAGWGLATSDFHGMSWGAPVSSADHQALVQWIGTKTTATNFLAVSVGMGATTSIAAMARIPEPAIGCWYSVSPIADLAAEARADEALRDAIFQAWGRVPDASEAPLAAASTLPTSTTFRIVVPPAAAPAIAKNDANALVSTLQSSGHAVSTTASINATDAAPVVDAADVVGFAGGCM